MGNINLIQKNRLVVYRQENLCYNTTYYGRSALFACAEYMNVPIQEERILDLIKLVEQDQIRTDLPKVDIGDFVRVSLRIKEGSRERIQIFEGTVIAKKGAGLSETFKVRRISYGVGVEKTFPLNSPKISGIEIVRKGKVRRAKLYYLRDRVGKAAKVAEKMVYAQPSKATKTEE